MNYLRLYKNIIRKAKARQAEIGRDKSFYMETHHIIPKCLLTHKKSRVKNGKWNLVDLLPREHFIVHKLLWKHYCKIFGKNNKNTKKLLYAWAMFFKGRKRLITSRQFENLRIHYSEAIKGENNPMFGRPGPNRGKFGKDHPMYGRKRPEHSERMSGSNHPLYGTKGFWTGKEGPNKGKKLSEETRKKISESLLKKKSFHHPD